MFDHHTSHTGIWQTYFFGCSCCRCTFTFFHCHQIWDIRQNRFEVGHGVFCLGCVCESNLTNIFHWHWLYVVWQSRKLEQMKFVEFKEFQFLLQYSFVVSIECAPASISRLTTRCNCPSFFKITAVYFPQFTFYPLILVSFLGK